VAFADKEAGNSLTEYWFTELYCNEFYPYQFELSKDGRKASCFRAQLNTMDELQR
jgi:hypothetical protein